jgi:predicted RecB family nuclease
MKITQSIFHAHINCPTKCWLKFTGEPATGNAYAEWVQRQNEGYHATAVHRLRSEMPPDERADAPTQESLKTFKWRMGFDVAAATSQNLETCLQAVERVHSEGRGKSTQFIPIRFVSTNKLGKDEKLLLAFDAFVLSKIIGREISIGKIIHGDKHAVLKVKTLPLAAEVQKRLDRITTLVSNPTAPDLVLNRHCAECEFQARCRQRAIEKNDLSLLTSLSEQERADLNGKGIFTVTQLSFTFRPRRRPKELKQKREKYHHSLKALAIREKRIHIVGGAELKIDGTAVYLDVEGLPDRNSYYLIGVRIGGGDSAIQHSLWADTIEDEGRIWRELLAILETVEKPVLVYYGSYEKTFLNSMCERHGKPPEGSIVAETVRTGVNLLSVIFAQIYFPTYSNGLKDIARWLGFNWSVEGASGVQSIMWRDEWEQTKAPLPKEKLIAYNSEDCAALELVARIVSRACKHNEEALVNAVAHRQYEDAGRKIMLEVFTDRVLVSSPGLPPSPITLPNLRKGKYRPCSRNPVLAQCLSYFHRIEERGSGFRRMRDQMLNHGLDQPLIGTDTGYFQVVFPGPGENLDRIRVPETRLTVTPAIEAQLNERQKKMLALLVAGEKLTSRRCEQEFGITRDTASRDFGLLMELGLADRQGRGRSTSYILITKAA